jgi:hypothetical protein
MTEGKTISKQIAVERFTEVLFHALDETFEQVYGIYLDRGASLFETLTSTYDFQAFEFYRKLGYYIIGQLDDYPDGYTLYWLRKDF